MRDIVVGTAGHIDHGKSSLVRALTGTDPDRLKEEKARGITVDLGFAHLEDGRFRYAFVDVPGHERFVRNMLAGAAGFDVMLLVVAADESVMPQTREHVEICRLLGVRAAVVALSRVDLADDPAFVELATLETRELLEGTPLEAAPVVPLSSVTGEGLDALRRALAVAAGTAGIRDRGGPLRLPVDRAFTMRGFGVVVTGTLFSGRVRVGDEVEVLPGGQRARVRGIQVHGDPVPEAAAGQRTALNLSGGGRFAVQRGSVTGTPGELGLARMLDVSLEVLAWAPAPVADGERVHIHIGTAVALARVRLLGGRTRLDPGAKGLAQLRLESPLVVVRRDRFIIRRYSPVITIGGGRVLDADPPKRSPRSPADARRVEALVRADAEEAAGAFLGEAGAGGLDESGLARRLGLRPAGARGLVSGLVEAGEAFPVATRGRGAAGSGRTLLAAAALERLEGRLRERIANWEAAHRLRPGMPVEQLREETSVSPAVCDAALDRLVAAGRLARDRDMVHTADREVQLTSGEAEVRDRLAQILLDSGYAPPTLNDLAAELGAPGPLVDALRRLLAHERRAVLVTPELAFDSARLDELKRAVLARGAVRREMDVAWFKGRFGLSRKHAIPLLEWLDRERITVRVGNLRRIRASAPLGPGSA